MKPTLEVTERPDGSLLVMVDPEARCACCGELAGMFVNRAGEVRCRTCDGRLQGEKGFLRRLSATLLREGVTVSGRPAASGPWWVS